MFDVFQPSGRSKLQQYVSSVSYELIFRDATAFTQLVWVASVWGHIEAIGDELPGK